MGYAWLLRMDSLRDECRATERITPRQPRMDSSRDEYRVAEWVTPGYREWIHHVMNSEQQNGSPWVNENGFIT